MNYQCMVCGTEINEGEFKTFGVCDGCWDKKHPRPADLPEAEASAERISSVVRSSATTGWISVKDRLPEKGACVITFEPHCINNPDKGIGVCEVDSDFTDKKSDGNFWITHWMPLPEPPEV